MNRGGETARVSDGPGGSNAFAVDFYQAVHKFQVTKAGIGSEAEIIAEVNDSGIFLEGEILQKCPAAPVSLTEEEYVHFRVGLRDEAKLCMVEIQVRIADALVGGAAALYVGDLGGRMVEQQTQQFSGHVAPPSDNADL